MRLKKKLDVAGNVVIKHPSKAPEIRRIVESADVLDAFSEVGGSMPENAVDSLGEIEFCGWNVGFMCRASWKTESPNILWPDHGVVGGPILIVGLDKPLDEEISKKIVGFLETLKIPSGFFALKNASA